MVRKLFALVAVTGVGILVGAAAAGAAPPAPAPLSGAIFTTDASSARVNLNIYAAKEDVYLNGGPGANAPAGAAGLPEGTYSFQVTEPSGKTLLSQDPVSCRQFTVDSSGVIRSVAPSGACAHTTGADGEDGGITVQLFPYADTPNNGGEYKVWVTPTNLLDCNARGNKYCFVPRFSKTDNFKVRNPRAVEIDTRFAGAAGAFMDGLAATWFDTNGASNVKYSEYDPTLLAFHEAHVEAAEDGAQQIVVNDQPGCKVVDAVTDGRTYKPSKGSVTVPVTVDSSTSTGDQTYRVDVRCAS